MIIRSMLFSSSIKIISFLIFFFSLSLTGIKQTSAGDLPPPETIGACCFEVGEGVCQQISLDECLSAETGIGWSDEIECELDTCIPDTSGAADCCTVHSSTACETSSCSETICEIDPYCCIFDWDEICVEEAFELCPQVCTSSGDPIVIVPTINQLGIIFLVVLMGVYSVFRLILIDNRYKC